MVRYYNAKQEIIKIEKTKVKLKKNLNGYNFGGRTDQVSQEINNRYLKISSES